jgi:hypothetical protein
MTVVTQLPAETIESLSERRFQLFRRLLFRRSGLTLREARAHVREINARLIEIGNQRNVPVIPVSATWYGLDPIHLRRRALRVAWSMMLASWRAADESWRASRSSLWTTAYLASLTPAEQFMFGIRRRAEQPSGRLPDGTTISLY